MIDKPIKILLLEDERSHAEALISAFETRGVSADFTLASDLDAARDVLRQLTPDLVISAWELPDGKGTDLLPQDPHESPFPLVVMANRGSEESAVRAIKEGALDYVVKSPKAFWSMPHSIHRLLREWEHLAERNRTEKALQQKTQELSERVKELNCLYEISNVIEDRYRSLEEILQGIVDLLPRAWQYQEIACARADVEGCHFVTDNFSESQWSLSAGIKVQGEKIGRLEVFYQEDTPERDEGPFLSEERSLINAVAERLGRIIEHKRAEQALRASEERFRAIFEGARDCIFLKDKDLRYTHLNQAMEKLLGKSASDLVGRRAESLFSAHDAARIKAVDLRVLSGKTIEEEITRTIHGVHATFHEIRVPLRDTTGEIIGICGISRDVTERKKAAPVSGLAVADYPSDAMKATLEKAHYAAAKGGTVLLQGESGTGKDYLARWIHDHSDRATGPFFVLNCAAVTHELAESELFGHERGAFTGATTRKRGLLELAEGGTLLLNEIGELPLQLQAKLLTFLDSKSFLRVGGNRPVQVNARIVAASHRDLHDETAEGRFLRPLLYRLDVFSITVPPLRERLEDIPLLTEQIMSSLAVEMQLPEVPVLEPSHIVALSRYHWPGNVRELRNVIERALMIWDGQEFNLNLPTTDVVRSPGSMETYLSKQRSLPDAIDELTRIMCSDALERCNSNRKEACRILGISRTSLYRIMKRLGLANGSETDAE